MARRKKAGKRTYQRRKTHLETLKELVEERRKGGGPHKVLRELVRERRAENLLLKELRSTIRKWQKAPSKLPRYTVARRWAQLLKM